MSEGDYGNDDIEEDDDDDHGMPWEEEAWDTIKTAVENAEIDDIRGAVTIESDIDHRFNVECTSYDDLHQELTELYDEVWYANAPFEGGEAVFDSDAEGAVDSLLTGQGFEEFFLEIREPEEAEQIILARELVETHEKSQQIQVELFEAERRLADYFAKNPQELRQIDPYKFEMLMAQIFRGKGFQVTRTPKSKDGGFDLVLIERNDLGAAMTLVDCKRYAAHKKVGVELVRGLYGVVEKQGATKGMIITTSSFTRGAIAERDSLKYRMNLAGFGDILTYLREWRSRFSR